MKLSFPSFLFLFLQPEVPFAGKYTKDRIGLASNFPFPSYAQYNELMAKMTVLEHLVKYTNLWDYFFHIFFFIFFKYSFDIVILGILQASTWN